MIGTINTSQNFQKTTQYIYRTDTQQIYANFCAAVTNDADRIADVMQTTAQQSVRVEKPCYHIAVSPSAEDTLSPQHWYHFTEDFLREMGLANRQAVGWLHHDATYPNGQVRPHLHLVVNRVGAMGQTYSTSWDYRRVDRVLRDLETKYQLEAVPPAQAVDVKRDSPGQVHRFKAEQAQYHDANHPRSTPPQPSVRRQLQTSIEEAIASATSPEGIADFLSRQGIETRISQQGWSFSKDQIHLAGNQLGHRYSLNSVQQSVDPPSPQHHQSTELDPIAPTSKPLAQMDEAIAQIDQRLSTLEKAVASNTQTPEKPGTEIAQSLEQFTQARTQFRGETEPSTFASSAGIVTLAPEGFQGQDTRITITDENHGTVFEAAKPANGEWDTQINELQPEQADLITQLPQSAEDYGQYKQGQQIVSALQTLTSKEFDGDRGQIEWVSQESDVHYHFDIERQADGTQHITGQDADSGTPVLNAAIRDETNIFITQNDIPNTHSQALFKHREQTLTAEPNPEVEPDTIRLGAQPRPSWQQQLER
jgi:hypothetical protein